MLLPAAPLMCRGFKSVAAGEDYAAVAGLAAVDALAFLFGGALGDTTLATVATGTRTPMPTGAYIVKVGTLPAKKVVVVR